MMENNLNSLRISRYESSFAVFSEHLRTLRLQQIQIVASGNSDKRFSELWLSCQQTREPWKVIQEVNTSQIADNGKWMMII